MWLIFTFYDKTDKNFMVLCKRNFNIIREKCEIRLHQAITAISEGASEYNFSNRSCERSLFLRKKHKK